MASTMLLCVSWGRRATGLVKCKHSMTRTLTICPNVCSQNSHEKFGASKQPPKKPKTPQGRLDEAENTNVEKEPLERFPDGINPVTKERGGPRGPEPTRYGDWERKGRCIDF
ncbi:hypothetical protein GDO86_016587 [Hymenochirus boettgeri]|uniref:Succinate dehydrogenase assembly factor 4, mitochondrial n=1 Tax=Hymenochirus boettgeri TaxID=247094 RepID=A0A8T2K5X2_9PIPI|nr:hypothetical protein GDO86_016587 [Hymenochirus boettgeri]